MKCLLRHLSFSFLVVIYLCVSVPSTFWAQTTGSTDPNSSSMPATAQQRKGVMTEEEFEKVDPVAAERHRYQGFLMDVDHESLLEKSYRDVGNMEMAESFRTQLQRRSGLTEEEATKVKKIAADYMVDLAALNQKGNELMARRKANHYHPPLPGSPPPPDSISQESVDIVNKAITRLVDALGSRSFSRLDLYTRYYLDAAKAKTDADTKTAKARQASQP